MISISSMLNHILQKIGFSQKEALIYLALLERGRMTASEIATYAKLNRATVYVVLDKLLERELIRETASSYKKYFSAVSPDELLSYFEEKKRDLNFHKNQIESLLPQFHALSNSLSVSPKIFIYDGLSGIKRVMSDTLKSRETLRCYSSMDAWFMHDETKDFIKWYAKQRVYKYNLPIKSVNLDTPGSRKYLEQDYPDIKTRPLLSHFRWLPSNAASFSSETNFYDNKIVSVIITKKEMVGIIIENCEMSLVQKTIFDSTWGSYGRAEWEKTLA